MLKHSTDPQAVIPNFLGNFLYARYSATQPESLLSKTALSLRLQDSSTTHLIHSV